MNARVKKMWLKALRSGEYEQGKGYLRNLDEDTYCCLGVLCDLAIKDGVVINESESTFSYPHPRVSLYDGVCSMLPYNVREWAQLEYSDPRVRNGNDPNWTLAGLNDSNNYAFNDIADIIEEQL